MPSRSFFRAYTHTDAYLPLPTAEQQGAVPPLAAARPPPANFTTEVGAHIAAGVQHLLNSQVMDWHAVANGSLPSAIYGAMSLGEFACPEPYNRSGCKDFYQNRDDRGNLPW